VTDTVWELFDLTDRVAIVTGGYGQLGSQVSDALAEAGANVVVAARTYAECEAKAAELSAEYSEAMAVEVDVTEEPTWRGSPSTRRPRRTSGRLHAA